MKFMRFPFEIREAILKLALHTDTTEPPDDVVALTKELRRETRPEDVGSGKRSTTLTAGNYVFLKNVHLPSRSGDTASLPVFYRTATCKNPALSLLLVSRQIHDETKRILGKGVDPASWEADVMFVKNVGLWTTWLSATRFLSHADTVHARFRSFNAPDTMDPTLFREVWRGGCGGPPEGVWSFFDLLVGFLEGNTGPFPQRRETDGPGSHEDGHRRGSGGVTVRRLVLDCLSSTEEDILPLNFTKKGRAYVLSDRGLDPALPEQKRAALALARFFAWFLRILLLPGLYDVDTSKTLYERVGEISILVDGEPYRDCDLSETIAGLSWGRGERWDSYKLALADSALQWKRKAIEKRRQAGFRVVVRSN